MLEVGLGDIGLLFTHIREGSYRFTDRNRGYHNRAIITLSDNIRQKSLWNIISHFVKALQHTFLQFLPSQAAHICSVTSVQL